MNTASNETGQLTWTAAFTIGSGLLVVALLPTISIGPVMTLLGACGAVMLVIRGWFMLAMASRDQRGAWPSWGPLQVVPWLMAAASVIAGLSLAALVTWWLGGVYEAAILSALSVEVAQRDVFSKAGYVVLFATLAWKTPLLCSHAARRARTYVELLTTQGR